MALNGVTRKTVKTVPLMLKRHTRLKPGVNEMVQSRERQMRIGG